MNSYKPLFENALLTGASGFLGQHIKHELSKIAQITTISRSDGDINVDLSLEIPKLEANDLVVHCAGKAHSLPKTKIENQAFFDVNLTGTANLLKGLELAPQLPKYFIFISTVAVYGIDSGVLIDENQPLRATDAYGQSKIQAEKLVQDWCEKKDVVCTILRLPLLVGKNPPGNLGLMVKGIRIGYYFNIAGGKAKKSMVLASDVGKLIPHLTKMGGIYNLTDGYHPSFHELAILIANQLGKKKVNDMPLWIAQIIGKIGNIFWDNGPVNEKQISKIRSDLTFDDSKAITDLNWKPNPVLEGFKLDCL